MTRTSKKKRLHCCKCNVLPTALQAVGFKNASNVDGSNMARADTFCSQGRGLRLCAWQVQEKHQVIGHEPRPDANTALVRSIIHHSRRSHFAWPSTRSNMARADTFCSQGRGNRLCAWQVREQLPSLRPQASTSCPHCARSGYHPPFK